MCLKTLCPPLTWKVHCDENCVNNAKKKGPLPCVAIWLHHHNEHSGGHHHILLAIRMAKMAIPGDACRLELKTLHTIE